MEAEGGVKKILINNNNVLIKMIRNNIENPIWGDWHNLRWCANLKDPWPKSKSADWAEGQRSNLTPEYTVWIIGFKWGKGKLRIAEDLKAHVNNQSGTMVPRQPAAWSETPS